MSRALVTSGKGALELVERDALAARDDEIVVAPHAVGVCGTDIELVDGLVDEAFVRYPLVLGHEWAGVVTSTSSERFAPGDRVVVEGIFPCWHCPQCVSGATNLCTTGYEEIGFTQPGAAADEIAVPARLAHRLPAGVALEDAALVEPASVVYHGLSRTLEGVGASCLVIGDGTIALLAVQLLQLWSPSTVVLAGRRPEQAELARAAGADEIVATAPRQSFDVVVEAAGTNDAVLSALAAANRGGRVLLLGLTPHGSFASVPVDDLVNNDLFIRASFGYTSAAWSTVVALLGTGRFHPSRLITHRFPLGQYAAAFELLRRPTPGEARGKIVLLPSGSEAGE